MTNPTTSTPDAPQDESRTPLPCPFCGSAAKMDSTGAGCTNQSCDAYMANVYLRTWNRRVPAQEEGGTTAPEIVEAVAALQSIRERVAKIESFGGCTNTGCIVKEPKGQHTNGRCDCARNREIISHNLVQLLRDARAVLAEFDRAAVPGESE